MRDDNIRLRHDVGMDLSRLLRCKNKGDSGLPSFPKDGDQAVRSCGFALVGKKLVRFINDDPHQRLRAGLIFSFKNCLPALPDGLIFLCFSGHHAVDKELLGQQTDNQRPDVLCTGNNCIGAHIKDGYLASFHDPVNLNSFFREKAPVLSNLEAVICSISHSLLNLALNRKLGANIKERIVLSLVLQLSDDPLNQYSKGGVDINAERMAPVKCAQLRGLEAKRVVYRDAFFLELAEVSDGGKNQGGQRLPLDSPLLKQLFFLLIRIFHGPIDAHRVKDEYRQPICDLFWQMGHAFCNNAHSVGLSLSPLAADKDSMRLGNIHIDRVGEGGRLAHLHIMLAKQNRPLFPEFLLLSLVSAKDDIINHEEALPAFHNNLLH